MAAPSKKTEAWAIFDRIVEDAASTEQFAQGPWVGENYEPDFETLQKLLGVPLYLKANSQSGVPALALDVWTAYELRRAGFNTDAVWPRASHPRVMPGPISELLPKANAAFRAALADQVQGTSSMPGVVASSANILGKHYIKQVDVVMSAWNTGPELLISTKRMDSSFGKNAANRIEESYGDAKNLRSRHPMAALGFLYGLRSTILDTERDKATWLIDLLQKLGREDDAYDSVCLLMLDYDVAPPEGSDGGHSDDEDATAPNVSGETHADPLFELDAVEPEPEISEVERAIQNLPVVRLLNEPIPDELHASRFFKMMTEHVMSATPVNMHQRARELRGWVASKA